MRASRHILILALLAGPLAAQQPRTIAVGQVATGELTAADPVGRSRRAPYHVWLLEGRRGQRLTIDMMSAEFDAYLLLRDQDGYLLGSDDDSGEGTNARLHAVLPRDGRYRIVATGYADSARGRYTLAVSVWEVPDVAGPGVAATIRPGETRNGLLEPGDETGGDGPFQDRWSLDVRAGQRLRVDMHSEDLDSYLVLLGPDGRPIAWDDDSGGGRDASLGLRAAADARYMVLATSYGDSPVSGAYRLTVSEDSGTFADPGVAATIADGETREGRLEAGDATGRRGLEDHWTFSGRAGQMARVDVMSRAFDTYVVLRFGQVPVDSNDDGGEGTNSRLMTVLPSTGTYTLIVSPYSRSSSGGRYTVSLSLSEAPPGAGRIEQIRLGQRMSGRLEPGDRVRSGGGYQDVWEFDGRADQDVLIEMRSSDFDAYLELRDADGAMIAQDDDSGGGTDALITTRLPRAGRYRITARSFGERQVTGAYELSLVAAGEVARPARVVEIRPDQTLFGRLEAGDSVIGDSTYADVFTFHAPQDGEVTIDLVSGDFDAYLILKDAEGTTLATDDDSGRGTNARIVYRVERGRNYRIYANSYGEDRATGAYRLTLHYGTR